MASAKKCRYCGEWLVAEASDAAIAAGYAPATAEPAVMSVPDGYTSEAELPVAAATMPPAPQMAAGQPMIVNAPGGAPASQPVVVVNNNIVQQTTVAQEQTVVVEEKEKKKSSGWLTFEMILVAIGVWVGAGAWWAGLIAFIVMSVLMFIPVLGTVMCIVLGCGMGLFAAGIAAAFDAPTWVCWIVGIIGAIGMSAINMDDRDAKVEED